VVSEGPQAPSRGDVVWLQFTPRAGHEQAGRRPAVVISPREYNEKVGLCLCCPVTSQVKGYPFEVELPEGLEVAGAVLCDQVKSLDWRARRARRIGSLPGPSVMEIQARILTLIQ
jgi:mRNA interferase MazF